MSGTQEDLPNPDPDPDLELDNEAKGEDPERDKTLEDTFPASDPPSVGGSTGPKD